MVVECFGGGLPSERFTGSGVECVSDCFEVIWSDPPGLDHIAPSELSRLLSEQDFEFLGGSVAEG